MTGKPDNLHVLGVSFATAPLAVRESLSYTSKDAVDLMRSASIDGLEEALVVSTCNRTEFYLVARPDVDPTGPWLAHVRRHRPRAEIGHQDCRLFRACNDDAIRHLFRVACGLDSAILGDVHIIGQLKHALTLSADAGRLGPLLDRAFARAFAVTKTAHAETEIGRGHASLGSAIAGVIRERRGAGLRILLIGAGVAARDIGRQLSKWRAGAITVMNRTEAAADALAQQIGGRPARLDALEDELSQADVVVSAISCDRELLTRDLFARCLRRPRDQRLLVVDAGLPRNAEHADDIDYVGVDDLFVRRNTALDRRTQAVPLVEGHIDDAVRRWQRWCWAQPGETLLRDVFVDEAARRSQLVDELLAAGFPGQREDLDRMVRHAWRPTLRTHARELRSWLHDDHSPTPDVRARGGDSMDFTHGTQP